MQKYKEFLTNQARMGADYLKMSAHTTATVALNNNIPDLLTFAMQYFATADGELAQWLSRVDEMVDGMKPATVMPSKGQFFIIPDLGLKYYGPACQRWRDMATYGIVSDPSAGYVVQFTADVDGRDVVHNGVLTKEFAAGDLLEYLGLGEMPIAAPGDPILFTHDNMTGGPWVQLRHALEFFEDNLEGMFLTRPCIDDGRGRLDLVGGYSRDWPSIPGHVVSIEPRCFAFTRLSKSIRSLDDLDRFPDGDFNYRPACLSLRQIFFPVEISAKAAAKKK